MSVIKIIKTVGLTRFYCTVVGWADNPEDRPTFDNLVSVLSKFAEEPERYLRIPVGYVSI